MKHWIIVSLVWLCGCNLNQPDIVTILPTQTTAPVVATATLPFSTPFAPEMTSESWTAIAPGLEQRLYYPNQAAGAQIYALRIDPTQFAFRAHYSPGQPYRLDEWRERIPDAVAVVNANFFDSNHAILGLLVSDGVVYGQSYTDRGGRFVVQNGQSLILSNIAQPYAGEVLEQAVQAFPMLVNNGLTAYTDPRGTQISRRTAIGQDNFGRIILLATPVFGLSLLDLSAFLPTTDMNLVNAFNLDGGGSTMMWIAPSELMLYSLDGVPAILAVYPK